MTWIRAHTHTWERSSVTDDSAAEQHSLLVSTCCSCGHVTWCQRMLMLRPAAAQSRLLSDNASLSSRQEAGFSPRQSLLGDRTFGSPQSPLTTSVFGNSHVPHLCLYFYCHRRQRLCSVTDPQAFGRKHPSVSDSVSEPCQQWRMNSLHPWIRRENLGVMCLCFTEIQVQMHLGHRKYKMYWLQTNPVHEFWIPFSIKA